MTEEERVAKEIEDELSRLTQGKTVGDLKAALKELYVHSFLDQCDITDDGVGPNGERLITVTVPAWLVDMVGGEGEGDERED